MPPTRPTLPPGWTRVPGNRPTYRRTDGYEVKLDNPSIWGVRAPGESRPFSKFNDQWAAMDWVDSEYPLEGAD